MWTIYSKQFDGNYLFLFTFSITALRILICASLQASQYKFLTEMIFCFLNLSLCEGGIVAPSQESERAHLHQSRRSCVAVLFSIPGYITAIYRRWSIHKKVSSICWLRRGREASHLVWSGHQILLVKEHYHLLSSGPHLPPVTEANLWLYQLHSSKSLCGVCLQSGTWWACSIAQLLSSFVEIALPLFLANILLFSEDKSIYCIICFTHMFNANDIMYDTCSLYHNGSSTSFPLSQSEHVTYVPLRTEISINLHCGTGWVLATQLPEHEIFNNLCGVENWGVSIMPSGLWLLYRCD